MCLLLSVSLFSFVEKSSSFRVCLFEYTRICDIFVYIFFAVHFHSIVWIWFICLVSLFSHSFIYSWSFCVCDARCSLLFLKLLAPTANRAIISTCSNGVYIFYLRCPRTCVSFSLRRNWIAIYNITFWYLKKSY